ncbi:MAG TPA: ABC transporter substrate-binding protein [Candidatus Acidoferrales bacterium]|nr:ABC transporter substrate-binding protein [Candidatus Acidoferrales bacterium]
MNRKLARVSLLFVLASFVGSARLEAAAPTPDLLKARRDAQAKGYVFYASHDEIVSLAKQEGRLSGVISLDPETFAPLTSAFKTKYPFIDLKLEEVTGTEATQRHMLEVQSGSARNDISYIAEDFYKGFIPHGKKFDVLGMAEHGVLAIPPKMIDPQSRKAISAATIFAAVAYNKCLLDKSKVPERWEDFLRPELKGKKFLVDIRPFHYQSFAAGAGEEWMLDYARKIAAQDPVWIRGASRILTAIGAGEYQLHSGINYHSTMRAKEKDKTGCLEVKIIEPVPVRLSEPQMVLGTAKHPHAGLLWLEFMASAEAQAIIDKYEPLKSSIYAPGSAVERLIRGKKIWLKDWNHYERGPDWMGMAVKAFGFPKAEK